MNVEDIAVQIQGLLSRSGGQAIVEQADHITPAIIARINRMVPKDVPVHRHHVELAVSEAAGRHPLSVK